VKHNSTNSTVHSAVRISIRDESSSGNSLKLKNNRSPLKSNKKKKKNLWNIIFFRICLMMIC